MLESNNFKIVIIITLLITALLTWIIMTLRRIRFQKRINNYVISKKNSEDISIIGKVESLYLKLRKRLIKYLKKNYIYKDKTVDIEENLAYTANKILSSIISLIIYILISLITFTKLNILLVIFIPIVGYLIPVSKNIIEKRINQKQIEKNLLKAISLINGSLQSGKSITQAIKTVSIELDGQIALEFKKIGKDLEKGLSLEVAFTRFKKRVKLEEIDYITVSLLILNKTGGNIISVFKSLEDRFYIRRKLNNELNSIAASSKLVFNILVFLPILIYLLIGFINPNYFNIFFKSSLGIILFSIILLIYLIYIITVKIIMKIEKY